MVQDEAKTAKLLPFRKEDAGVPLVERSEEELMLLARADRADAFEVLVARYLPRLSQFCAKFLGERSLGEEVAQDVLVSLWDMRHRYRPDAAFPVLLFTLARNRCRNQVRNQKRRGLWQVAFGGRSRDDGEDRPLDAASTEPGQLDVLIARENEARVREALQELPDKLREALLLRFDQGLNYAELAKIAGTNESTARSRVFHGIKKLQAELERGDA